jgi:ankyrin repeat protein
VEVVATLVELGADIHAVNARGSTPLHLAGSVATVTLLLEEGAQLHRRNHHGNTPLYHAIRIGQNRR